MSIAISRKYWLLSGLLIATTSAPALAQSLPANGPAADEASDGLADIVVTARRRSESIQNVPTMIQAVSGEALTVRGIKSDADLQTAVPGLIIRTGAQPSQATYVIRGESAEPYSGSAPGVQPYFNEVALSGNAGTAFYDLENVQVLKGPQGTLFGRNSTGGAVLYQSAAPKSELGGFGSVQYGNLEKLILEGAVNVPLIEDKMLLRVAGTYQSGGDFVRNIYNGNKFGDTKVKSGRATLTIAPDSQFRNTLMVQYSRFGGTGPGNRVTYVEPCGGTGPNIPCWANPGNAFFQSLINSAPGTFFPGYPDGTVYPGGLQALPGYLDSLGKYYVATNVDPKLKAHDLLITNSTTYELSDALTLKNIFGYTKTFKGFKYDGDGIDLPIIAAGGGTPGGNQLETRETRGISNEFQFQGKAADNKLNYIVGLFYANNRRLDNSPLAGFGYIPAINFPFTYAIRYKAVSKDITKAVFAQATYALTSELNFTGGIRFTNDKLSARQDPLSSAGGTPYLHTTQNDKSWTASMDYHVTPSLMLYATTRGSWRVGGYNVFVAGVGNTTPASAGGNFFPRERIRDVELGAKFRGRVADVPTRFNIAAYNAWITNIQKTAYGVVNGQATSATTAVPKAKVSGFETDGDILPAPWLRFGGSLTYTDARYTDNVATVFGQAALFGPYGDAPKWSGTAYGEATVPLSGDAGSLLLHVDVYGQTKFHLTNLGNTFNPGDLLPGYIIGNARLDWSDPVGVKGLTASLFVKNFTNKLYYLGGTGDIQIASTNFGIYAPPRTYGFVLRFAY